VQNCHILSGKTLAEEISQSE